MDQCTVKAINDHVWLMRDEHNDTCYLIAGQKKALVADTMSGFLNVREQAEKLTSLPLMVINTHGHGDHVLGNPPFEEAYLHPADQFMIDNLLQSPQYKAARKKHGIRMPEMKPVRGGDTFDLGGLTAQIIALPGHTPGGICILIREDRLLITGDSINRHLWMQLKGCTSLRAYAARLEAIRPVTERADLILHGHASGAEPISLFDDMLRGVKEVAEGHTEKDTDYQWFGGTARQHPFAENSVIVYDPALQE